MRTVLLYGHLGQQFGRRHRFDIATPAEALRALKANHAGFEQALLAHGGGYHILAIEHEGTAVCEFLNRHGYPPDLQEEAVKTVLMQAELLCAEWV
jgi:predicted phage tail protein